MKEIRAGLLVALLLMAFGAASIAQKVATRSSQAETATGVLFVNGLMISLKTQAPFSAVITEDRTLSDGTKITRASEPVMRDREGRIYREERTPAPGFEQSHIQITISDPSRHFQYICQQESKSCIEVEYKPITGVRRPTKADGGNSKQPVTLEDLGTTSVAGVTAEGVRIIQLVPEGQIGNDRPLTLTTESWRSQELGVDVQTKEIDPRIGTRTISMSEVSLADPDPKYFGVPAGYELSDMREQIAKAKGAQ
jgi:hypothetical protein